MLRKHNRRRMYHPMIDHATVLHMRPGDKLILHTPKLANHIRERIRQMWARQHGIQVAFLPIDWRVSVLRKEKG